MASQVPGLTKIALNSPDCHFNQRFSCATNLYVRWLAIWRRTLVVPAEVESIIQRDASDATSESLRKGGPDKQVPPKVKAEVCSCLIGWHCCTRFSQCLSTFVRDRRSKSQFLPPILRILPRNRQKLRKETKITHWHGNCDSLRFVPTSRERCCVARWRATRRERRSTVSGG